MQGLEVAMSTHSRPLFQTSSPGYLPSCGLPRLAQLQLDALVPPYG